MKPRIIKHFDLRELKESSKKRQAKMESKRQLTWYLTIEKRERQLLFDLTKRF